MLLCSPVAVSAFRTRLLWIQTFSRGKVTQWGMAIKCQDRSSLGHVFCSQWNSHNPQTPIHSKFMPTSPQSQLLLWIYAGGYWEGSFSAFSFWQSDGRASWVLRRGVCLLFLASRHSAGFWSCLLPVRCPLLYPPLLSCSANQFLSFFLIPPFIPCALIFLGEAKCSHSPPKLSLFLSLFHSCLFFCPDFSPFYFGLHIFSPSHSLAKPGIT